MKRLHLLIIILAIAIAYKLVVIKIDRDFHRFENQVYEDITNIYDSISNQNDLIMQSK